jgi:hypothetical protein
MQTMKFLLGIVFVLFGLFLICFRSRISQFAVSQWHKTFPNIKIWEKGYDVFILVGGGAFIVFGLLSVMGIIKFK